MKVSELIEELKKCNPNSLVVLHKERSGVRELFAIDNNTIYQKEDRDGEPIVYGLDGSADDHCLEEDEWEEMKKTETPCLVLI